MSVCFARRNRVYSCEGMHVHAINLNSREPVLKHSPRERVVERPINVNHRERNLERPIKQTRVSACSGGQTSTIRMSACSFGNCMKTV